MSDNNKGLSWWLVAGVGAIALAFYLGAFDKPAPAPRQDEPAPAPAVPPKKKGGRPKKKKEEPPPVVELDPAFTEGGTGGSTDAS